MLPDPIGLAEDSSLIMSANVMGRQPKQFLVVISNTQNLAYLNDFVLFILYKCFVY